MFTKGTRVSEKVVNRRSRARKGSVVAELDKNGTLMVEWDAQGYYVKASIERVAPNVLMLEKDALQKEAQLDAEFNQLENELQNKMSEAAKLINEASKIAKSRGENLADMYEAVSPLVSAMDGAGWNTSSWGC